MKSRRRIILALMVIAILLSSCSRAYQPTNVQKRKGNCGTCSRW